MGMHRVRINDCFRVLFYRAVDIHPGARIGRGVMLDHATGIVIGETCVVGDNVSMLHHVCLGGSGTGRGVRHPQVHTHTHTRTQTHTQTQVHTHARTRAMRTYWHV